MGLACRGITHCRKCGTSLNMNEYGLCKNCKKEEKEGKNMSKKIYKGYELIKAIADGEIKERKQV